MSVEKLYNKTSLSKVRVYSSRKGTKANSLSYYMSRLNDKDLNHAYELKLFALTDICSAPCNFRKYDFFGSMEELMTEN